MNALCTVVALRMMALRDQLKIFHWQTTSFAVHKSLDGAVARVTDFNDRWTETAMGKYGRVEISSRNGVAQFPLVNLAQGEGQGAAIAAFLAEWTAEMREIRDENFADSANSDLSNIFDELFGSLNRLRYLLSLR